MGLLDSLIDKEKATHDTIQSYLEEVAQELNIEFNQFFVMIKAKDNKYEPSFFIYSTKSGKPEFVKEVTIKDILGE